MSEVLKGIYASVIAGDAEGVEQGVNKALEQGIDPAEIINAALISAMDEVGAKMHSGELFVPEVLVAAEAMKAGLTIVKPLLKEGSSYSSKGKVVLGTVAGDLHDIGKNLVGMLLESAGFEIVDLGTDVAKENFLAAVEEHKPGVVGISALLTTTMGSMADTSREIKEKYPEVKVMIGGAPVSSDYAEEIGADGYAPDGAAAVELARKLIG